MKYNVIKHMLLITVICLGISACGNNKEADKLQTENTTEEITEVDDTNVEDEENVKENIKEKKPFEKFTGYTTTVVNVRKEASSDSDSYGTVKYNTKLTIVGEDGEWYEVKVGDNIGYIAKSFISTEEMPEIVDEEKEEKNDEENKSPENNKDTNVDGINQDNENKETDTNNDTEESNSDDTTNTSKPEAGNVITGDSYQQEVLNQINEYRQSNGLGTLALTDKLCASAATRASEIAYTGSHSRPDGSKWITSLTFSPKTAIAENGGHVLPEHSIVEAWKESSSHNAQLLNSAYTVCGIGYYTTDDGGKYVALHLY